MNYSSVEQELDASGYLCMTPLGRSMWPMLRGGRDNVYLEKAEGQLQEDDVALFRTEAGKYILHRVIQAESDHYIFRGDNVVDNVEYVLPSQVVAVLKRFYRGKRWISCESEKYKIYVAIWKQIYPIRKIIMRCRHRMVGLVKKMTGRNR